MSESLKPPIDDGPSFDPQRIKIEPLLDERGKPIPIELFLLSSRGKRTMENFIVSLVDELEGNRPLTRFMHQQLEAASREEGREKYHPIAIMASLGTTDGFRDPTRQALFAANPLIYRLDAHKNRSLHEDATDTPKLYSHIKIIMMNVIRYEALQGIYNPEEDIWKFLADGFEHVKGHDHLLSHSLRMNPITHLERPQ